jgi:predicted nucleotidyltransferase
LLNLKKNIVSTLAYFDMFDYPLSYNEIFLFLECGCGEGEFKKTLNDLLACKLIYQFDNFYSLKNDFTLITRRNQGNKKAQELLKKAKTVGQLLIRFPYVRGIGISGSLSKNFADENSDIDLFIITKKNRLWIARTLMHFFKKLTFLVNKQHYYCMNYYIDEVQLEIVEKNIYTAIEVATLIPLEGDSTFAAFYSANTWAKDYLPNKTMRTSSTGPIKNYVLKTGIELLFNNTFGCWIEQKLMGITAERWNKKTQQKKLNSRGTVMGMSVGKHFAKPDPVNFQVKLIERYRSKLTQLLSLSEITTV